MGNKYSHPSWLCLEIFYLTISQPYCVFTNSYRNNLILYGFLIRKFLCFFFLPVQNYGKQTNNPDKYGKKKNCCHRLIFVILFFILTGVTFHFVVSFPQTTTLSLW